MFLSLLTYMLLFVGLSLLMAKDPFLKTDTKLPKKKKLSSTASESEVPAGEVDMKVQKKRKKFEVEVSNISTLYMCLISR